MASGTVKRVPNVKNYGFIVVGEEPTTEEVFFHRTGVADDAFDQLSNGQRVTFELVRDERDTSKRRAVDVAPVER